MGALSLIAGILSITLPETNDVPLDEIVEKAQDASAKEHDLQDKFLLTDGIEKGEAPNGNTHPAEDEEANHDRDKPEAAEDKEVLIGGKNSAGKDNDNNPVA